MPVKRGHVAPKTTLIETIIRKFDTHSKFQVYFFISRLIFLKIFGNSSKSILENIPIVIRESISVKWLLSFPENVKKSVLVADLNCKYLTTLILSQLSSFLSLPSECLYFCKKIQTFGSLQIFWRSFE